MLEMNGTSLLASSAAHLQLKSCQQGQQPQDYTKAWEEYYKKQGGRCGGFSDQPCVVDCSQVKLPHRWPRQVPLSLEAIQTTAQPRPSIIASRRLTMARVALGPWEQHRRPSSFSRRPGDKTLTKLFSFYTGLFISLLGVGVVGGVEFSLNEKLRVVSNKPEVEI
ncbi:hypothetical protein MHYP_G00002080 [Metynnis hypsauchen]